MNRLPAIPRVWTPEWEAQRTLALEARLRQLRGPGDVELQRETKDGVDRDERLILRSPNGTRYALYVNDYGEIHTSNPDTATLVTVYRWDDLTFAAGSIAVDPSGPVAPPTPNRVEAEWPGALEFSGTVDNMIAGMAQVPHKARDGTAAELHPHIHWLKMTGSSSAVTWEFFYRWVGNVGSTAGSWSTAQSATLQAGSMSVSNQHLLSSFPAITLTDRKDSAMLAWRLYRRGSSDAENNAVTLLELDFHYESDSNTLGGSYAEYPS